MLGLAHKSPGNSGQGLYPAYKRCFEFHLHRKHGSSLQHFFKTHLGTRHIQRCGHFRTYRFHAASKKEKSRQENIFSVYSHDNRRRTRKHARPICFRVCGGFYRLLSYKFSRFQCCGYFYNHRRNIVLLLSYF